MTVKVFECGKDGKISFTKKELEKLLNDVYKDGHDDGYREGCNKPYWYWTSPYYGSITCGNGNLNDNSIHTSPYTITYCGSNSDSDVTLNKAEIKM